MGMYTTQSSIWPTLSRGDVVSSTQRHGLRHTDLGKTIVVVTLRVRTIAMQNRESSRAKTWHHPWKAWTLGCKADPCSVTVPLNSPRGLASKSVLLALPLTDQYGV